MKKIAIAAVAWGSNRLDIFGLGADNQMYHKAWDGTAWRPSTTGWKGLGGVFNSAPAVVSWGSNRLDIFALGTDNQMYHKAWDGSRWLPSPTGWEPLGGVFNSAPAVVSWGSNRLDIFALGTDNQMYHKAWDGSAWRPSMTGWEGLGGVFNSAPAVVSWGSNRLDIFGLGTDNQMYHKAWDGTAWRPSVTGWEGLGGVFNSAPAVVSWGSNRLDIFGLGTDNQMYHKAWDGSAWRPSMTGWEGLGGVFNSAPAVVSWGSNRLDIFGLGTDNQMYHKAWDGSVWRPSMTDWEGLGGVFNSAPAVVSWGSNRLDIFGLGTDNQMYHKAWDGSAWRPSMAGWEGLGGVFNIPIQKGPPCNCNSCPGDQTLTCSYIGEDQYVEDAYIANAYRGNLLLTPGDASGVIGGLLHALNPPQHYSHMGIMVADHDLIRHCTMSQERLVDPEYYSGSLLGVPAPLEGLNVDHTQYGWPGTITESVYQAVFADRYGTGVTPPGYTSPYTGSLLTDSESAQSPKKSYLMSQLGFDPVSDDGQTYFPPLVVKPCPLLETPLHTATLSLVVEQALAIYAHYRFYAYTNGLIGGIPDFSGPSLTLPDSRPDFDASTGRWADWSANVKWVTKPTIPAVCSSFAWQAIQNVFGDVGTHAIPEIILDWASTQAEALGEDNGQCVRAIAPSWQADSRDATTSDGLFFYNENDRKIAGTSLHDNLSQVVYDSLKQSLHDAGGVEKAVANVVDDVGRGAFIAAAGAGVAALSNLLLPLLGQVVVDAEFLGKLIELLYDMPEDIANQTCNLFAFDCARGFPGDTHCVDALGNTISSVDSDNWSSAPGAGRAVSPDNIHMFWDAPGSASAELIQGLYGFNAPAQIVVGVVNKPKCALVPSTGTATIAGYVLYQGRPLAGAYVSAGCVRTITTPGGVVAPGPDPYVLQVRSGGQYKIIARYEDPITGRTLYGEAVTGRPTDQPIQPNSNIRVDVTVTDPPECMRQVVIQGIVRVDDVYVTGSDHDEKPFRRTLFLQYGVAVFDTTKGSWVVDTSAGKQRLTDSCSAGCSVGDSHAQLKISGVIDDKLNVSVTLEGLLNPGDDNMSTGPTTFTVAKDQTISVPEANLDTGGPFNDRAYFRGISIANNPAPAI